MDSLTKAHLLGCLLVALLSLSVRCQDDVDEDTGGEVGENEFGGVNIKVFRGPTSMSSGGEMFAPFGYYVKMPVASPGPYNKGPAEEEDPEEEDFNFSEEDFNKDNF